MWEATLSYSVGTYSVVFPADVPPIAWEIQIGKSTVTVKSSRVVLEVSSGEPRWNFVFSSVHGEGMLDLLPRKYERVMQMVFGTDEVTVVLHSNDQKTPLEILQEKTVRTIDAVAFLRMRGYYRSSLEELFGTVPQPYEVSADGKTFYVEARILAEASLVFRQFFGKANFVENRAGVYIIQNQGKDAVERFLAYCYRRVVPDMQMYAVELARLGHMYQMKDLVAECELLLINRSLVENGPDDIGSLVKLGVELRLDLLLVALHLILKERHKTWSREQRLRWAQITEDSPDICVEINRAVAVRAIRVKSRSFFLAQKVTNGVGGVESDPVFVPDGTLADLV